MGQPLVLRFGIAHAVAMVADVAEPRPSFRAWLILATEAVRISVERLLAGRAGISKAIFDPWWTS